MVIDKAADVVSEAVIETFNDTPVVPGIAKGGSRVRGTIPYDTQQLADSLRSRINGRTVAVGQESFRAAAAQFKMNDRLSFGWGYGAAPYARWVHNGANGVRGTFWTDVMKARFPVYLDIAAARRKK
jgi:hypothetical protein